MSGSATGVRGQRDDCTALGRVQIGNLGFGPGKGGVQTAPRSRSKDGCSAEVVVGREEGFGEREGITRSAMVILKGKDSTTGMAYTVKQRQISP